MRQYWIVMQAGNGHTIKSDGQVSAYAGRQREAERRQAMGTPLNPMRHYWIGMQAGKGHTIKSDWPVLDWYAGRQGAHH